MVATTKLVLTLQDGTNVSNTYNISTGLTNMDTGAYGAMQVSWCADALSTTAETGSRVGLSQTLQSTWRTRLRELSSTHGAFFSCQHSVAACI